MTTYSLTARHWWMLPATAGAISTATLTAILVVPATGHVAPAEVPPATTGAGVTDSVTIVDRPCYLTRPDWNTVAGWEHPVCATVLRGRVERPAYVPGRPAPDYLP